MKMRAILISMLAVAIAAASCNKDEDSGRSSGQKPQVDVAYLAVRIDSGASTYANGNGDVASENVAEESDVQKAYAVTFDSNKQKLDVVSLKVTEYGITNGSNGNKVPQTGVAVNPDSKYLLVVLNPSTGLLAAMHNAVSFADFQKKLDGNISEFTQANNFTMINYGDFPGSQLTSTEIPMPEITKGVNLFVVDQTNNTEAAIQEALKTPVRVTVGRLSVKVALMNQLNQDLVQSNVAKGALACSLTGWQFSVVNKSYLAYSSIVPYMDGSTIVADHRRYRQDGNFDAAVDPETEFIFLKNRDNIATAATPIEWFNDQTQYVMENTMAADAQLKGHTTTMIAKAIYTPEGIDGVNGGDTWISIIKDEVETRYSVENARAQATRDTNIKSLFDQIAKAQGYAGATELFDALNADNNDAKLDNVGYTAAKYQVEDAGTVYYARVYRKSVCYYDVQIKHNNTLEGTMALGKYGVVRNNHYTINFKEIKAPGIPFIPDPTDPDIIDKGNPDEDDKDEDSNAYISVTISIQPWTLWTQDVVIG